MNIWIKSILTGIAFSLLVFILFKSFFPSRRINLFDARYQVKITPPANDSVYNTERVQGIIFKRMDKAGYYCEIKKINDRVLDIMVNNVDDTALVASLLSGSGSIKFMEVYPLNVISEAFITADKITRKYLAPGLPPKETFNIDSSATDSSELKKLGPGIEYDTDYRLTSLVSFNTYANSNNQPDITAMVRVADTAILNRILHDKEVTDLMPNDAAFYYGPADANPGNEKYLTLYCLRIRTNSFLLLENEDIASARTDFDKTGLPQVSIEFKALGAKKFAKMTKDNTGKKIAIVFDNSVLSAPNVISEVTGGNSVISGGFTVTEARSLAIQISSEKIPASLRIQKSEIKMQKPPAGLKTLLFILIAFAISTAGSWFVFNTLKKS